MNFNKDSISIRTSKMNFSVILIFILEFLTGNMPFAVTTKIVVCQKQI